MNMNRIKNYIIFILLLLLVPICSVYASCSDYKFSTQTECESHSEDGYKCKMTYSNSQMAIPSCDKSDTPASDNDKSTSSVSCKSLKSEDECEKQLNDNDENQCYWATSGSYSYCDAIENDPAYYSKTIKEKYSCEYYSTNNYGCPSWCFSYDGNCSDKCPTGTKVKNKSSNVCEIYEEEYVAENPCNEDSIKKVLKIFGYILKFARFIVPLIIIGIGTFDLFKAVTSNDDKSLSKQVKILGIRIIIGVFIFFIPNIVTAAFKLSDKTSDTLEDSGYKMCANCLLHPDSCSISED